MKQLLTLLLAVMTFSACTPVVAQSAKPSLLGSIFSKNKTKDYLLKTDSVKPVVNTLQQPSCNFIKDTENENEIMISQYVYNDFLQNGLKPSCVRLPRFVVYRVYTNWASIVFNNLKLDLYPTILNH